MASKKLLFVWGLALALLVARIAWPHSMEDIYQAYRRVWPMAKDSVPQVELPTGSASGFYMVGATSGKPLLITCLHVCIGQSTIKAEGANLKVLKLGTNGDLCAAEAPSKAAPLSLSPTAPKPGDMVLILGYPAGLPLQFSQGWFVGPVEGAFYPKLMEQGTTASGIYGNSGGPMLNDKGEVIGVTSQVDREGHLGGVRYEDLKEFLKGL